MKVTITGSGAKLYDRIGFTALTVAEVPAGTEIDILTLKKQDGQRWASVTLCDGRSGYMAGETQVYADDRQSPLQEVYSRNSLSKRDEREDSKGRMVRGACWFVGGAAGVATAYACIVAQGPIWLVVMLMPGAIFCLIRGGVGFFFGLLAYLGTVAD